MTTPAPGVPVPENVREWLAPLLALIGGGGIGALIQAWRKPSSRAEDATAEATADHALTEKFLALTTRLEERLKRVEEEADRCQAESAELRKENEDLRREVAELKDRLKHLEESRLARDIADAAKGAPGTFTTIEGNKVTTLRPPRQSRREDGQ